MPCGNGVSKTYQRGVGERGGVSCLDECRLVELLEDGDAGGALAGGDALDGEAHLEGAAVGGDEEVVGEGLGQERHLGGRHVGECGAFGEESVEGAFGAGEGEADALVVMATGEGDLPAVFGQRVLHGIRHRHGNGSIVVVEVLLPQTASTKPSAIATLALSNCIIAFSIVIHSYCSNYKDTKNFGNNHNFP